MVMVPTMSQGRVAVLPVGVAIVTAIGVRVARSLILAVGVRVKECAIAGLRDNLLCHYRLASAVASKAAPNNAYLVMSGLLRVSQPDHRDRPSVPV